MSSSKILNFKASLLKKMYGLQNEINRLFINYPENSEKIALKEVEISRLFSKLRRVRDNEKLRVQSN
jgi:hypothetical protein